MVDSPGRKIAGMRVGITNAVAAWNAAFAGIPGTPVFETTETPCSGQYCVTTQQDNISTGSECAVGAISVNPGTGEILSATITFPSASSNWSENFTTRLAAHELGHTLGLANNNTSCATTASLMRPVSCNANGGFPVTPQPSDALPVTKTTYGQTPPPTCPAS